MNRQEVLLKTLHLYDVRLCWFFCFDQEHTARTSVKQVEKLTSTSSEMVRHPDFSMFCVSVIYCSIRVIHVCI